MPRVIIFVAPKQKAIDSLPRLINFLKERRWEILDVIMLGDKVKDKVLRESNLILTLGGDGTILYASRQIGEYSIPILGINFGKIGLLTELNIEEFYKYAELIETGNYRILTVHKIEAINLVTNQKYPPVLNEYAVITNRPGKVLGLKILINDEELSSIISDGLIISTPLGSSSYSLSVGGPLVHESINAIILAPLAPLFRSMYPMVLPSKFSVTLRIAKDWSDAYLVADGNIVGTLPRGTAVKFIISKQIARFIRLKEDCYRFRRIMNLFNVARRFESSES